MASRRQLILEAFRDRVQDITVATGYQTDAGKTVLLGEVPDLGPDDPDVAIAILPNDDEVKYVGANVSIKLPVLIAAIAKASIPQPWVAIEAVLADIKRAVELEDRTLDGLVQNRFERGSTRPAPRVPGSLTVAATIQYTAPYVEAWGRP